MLQFSAVVPDAVLGLCSRIQVNYQGLPAYNYQAGNFSDIGVFYQHLHPKEQYQHTGEAITVSIGKAGKPLDRLGIDLDRP